MPIARVQHIYHGTSNLPKDQFVTTFHFLGNGALTEAQAIALVALVESFYKDFAGQATMVLNYHAGTMFRPLHTSYKVYNMSQPKPRVPVFIGAPAAQSEVNMATPLPSEVAVCLSYNGTPQAGVLPARNRGRIYFGPLNVNAMVKHADGNSRPAPAFTTDLRVAAKRLATASGGSSWPWCGYSPTTREDYVAPPTGGLLNPGAFTITNVSTDDAFDTQRRRGVAPLARVALAVP